MNNRFKGIRLRSGLSQGKFGARVGVTHAAISKIESGERNITDQMILAICREFHVNEEWLRTGDGEMFVASDNTLIAQLVGQYGLDEFDQKILEIYVGLPEGYRAALKEFSRRLADVAAGSGKTEFSDGIVPDISRRALSDDDIDAEVESFRRELEEEKRAMEKLSVSETERESS